MRMLPACMMVLVAGGFSASAALAQQPFDWRKFDGETINFLSATNPAPDAIIKLLPEFTELTGIKVVVDSYNEGQMRQRLMTLMQTQSSAVDLIMTIPVREGQLFTGAGYYADLKPLLNDPDMTPADYDYTDFSPALTKTSNLNGITFGIPLDIQGPVLSYRMDLFKECNIELPATLEDIVVASEAIRKCKPDIVPFSARGHKDSINFTFGPMLYNFGGSYEKPTDGNYLCNESGIKAAQFYIDLLNNYGPPGVSNYSFAQITELMGQGRAAMTLETSNEYGRVTTFPDRAGDVGVTLLPPGKESGVQTPTVLGWHLAISAFSERKSPAWYFIAWATSKEMEARLVAEGIAPPRTSVFKSPQFAEWAAEFPGRQQWLEAVSQLASKGTGSTIPSTKNAPEMSNVINTALTAVLLGQSDARTALCDAEPKIKERVAR